MISRILFSSLRVAGKRSNNGSSTTLKLFDARRYSRLNKSADFRWTTWLSAVNAKIANEIPITSGCVAELLEQIDAQKISTVHALEILEACSVAGFDRTCEYNVMDEVWKRLKQANVELKYPHYDCMLSYYSIHGNGNAAQSIYDDMINAGYHADWFHRIKIFKAYCLDGNVSKAAELMKEFDQNIGLMTESLVNNFIQCHIKNGDIDKADDLFKILEAKKLNLNIATLKELESYYLRKNDVPNVKRVFQLVRDIGMPLSNRDVLEAILKLSAGSTESVHYRALLGNLSPNEECQHAINDVMPEFVKCDRSTVVPEILEAVDPNIAASANSLFKEMAVQRCPAKEFEQVWQSFKQIGFDIHGNIPAYKPALRGQSYKLIKQILGAMDADPAEKLEPKHFDQFLKLAADRGMDELMDAINLMCTTYETRPNRDYISKNIMPLLRETMTYPDALLKLRKTDIRYTDCIFAGIIGALSEDDMQTAQFIVDNNTLYMAYDFIIQPLQSAYRNTKNVSLFARIVRLISERITIDNLYHMSKKQINYTEADIKKARDEFLGRTIRTTMRAQHKKNADNIKLLKGLLREGLIIPTTQTNQIRWMFRFINNTGMLRLLNELSTDPKDRTTLSTSNIAQYIREKNMEAIEAMINNDVAIIADRDYASMIDHRCRQKQLKEAIFLFDSAIKSSDQFKMDSTKVFFVIDLMIEQNAIDASKIVTLLEHTRPPMVCPGRSKILESVLHNLANADHVELVHKITRACIDAKCVQPSNSLFGVTIYAELIRNNFTAAVDAYECIAKTYKLAPATNILFNTLIKNDLDDLIARTFDIYHKMHSKKAATIQLALAYCECGHYEKAHKLFQDKCIPKLAIVISNSCRTFAKHSHIASLEGLLYSTRGLNCDRSEIYESLLQMYCENDLVDSVLALQQYSEEDTEVAQKPEYLKKLEEFFLKKKVQV